MLVRLLYCSEMAEPRGSKLLEDIMVQSRRFNPERGVTGLLCVSDAQFIQVLEGGRAQVSALYNAIVRDPRHTQVTLLSFEEITERTFGSWSMGQVELAKINPGLLLKYFEHAKLEPTAASGRATKALLEELLASGAIVQRAES